MVTYNKTSFNSNQKHNHTPLKNDQKQCLTN